MIDKEIYLQLKRLAEIKNQELKLVHVLSDKGKGQNQFVARLEAIEGEQEDLKTKLLAERNNLGGIEAKLGEIEKQLSNANAQANQALVDRFTLEKDEVEDKIFKQMVVVEELEKEWQEFAAHQEERQSNRKKRMDEYEAEKNVIRKEQDSLAETYSAELLKLPANLRALAERTLKTIVDQPCVFIKNTCCGGCGMRLEAEKVSKLERQEGVFTCTFCHRLLLPQNIL